MAFDVSISLSVPIVGSLESAVTVTVSTADRAATSGGTGTYVGFYVT